MFGQQQLGFANDPSAGSHMQTLLRLLLPLNNSVRVQVGTQNLTIFFNFVVS